MHQDIVELYLNGASLREIATKCGVCKKTIRKRLADSGITIRKPNNEFSRVRISLAAKKYTSGRDGWKVCARCGREKPHTSFNRNSRLLDGLCSWCRECTHAHQKAYRGKHKEEIRNKNRDFYQANKTRFSATSREYRREHEEELKEKAKARYHRTKCQYILRARARRRGLVQEMTTDQWQAVLSLAEGKCTYCLLECGKLTRDHVIPISRGGTDRVDNIVAACGSCNDSKGTKLLAEWASQDVLQRTFLRLDRHRGLFC